MEPSGTETNPGRDWPWIAALWLLFAAALWPALSSERLLYFRDAYSFYIPLAAIATRAWLSGELPLWEPTIGMGYPFHAEPHSAIFYPISLLAVLLPFPLGYNASVLLHVPLLGTFQYLLLRRWRLGPASAALGAAAIMFSGFTLSTTALVPMLRGLTWIPLILFAFDRFHENGGIRPVLAAALALGVQGSGGDPTYVCLSVALLALSRWLRPRPSARSAWQVVAAAATAAAIALVLLAYQLLPLASLLARSDRLAIARAELMMNDVHPVNLYNLALPAPFPDVASPYVFTSYYDGAAPFLTDIYFGLPMLLLMLAALGWARRPDAEAGLSARGPVLVLAAMALFAVLMCLGKHLPVFGTVVTIAPFLKMARFPAKYFLLAAWAMTLLAAFGYEGLVRRLKSCERAYLTGMAAALLGLAALHLWLQTHWLEFPRLFLKSGGAEVKIDPTPLLELVSTAWAGNIAHAAAVLASIGAVWMASRLGKLTPVAALAGVGLLSVADLVGIGRHAVQTGPVGPLMRVPRAAELLGPPRPGGPPGRLITYPLNELSFGFDVTNYSYTLMAGEMLEICRASLWGVDSILAVMSVRTEAANELIRIMGEASGRDERDRIAAKCGATLVVSPEGLGNTPGNTPKAGEVGPVVIRRLEEATPRVFIAPRAVSETRAASAAILALPGEVAYEGGEAGRALEPRAIRSCRVAHYGRNRMEIEFDLEGEGLLVVLDTHYPGWKARVDGQERPVFKAGGLFRGVRVRGGERVLEMVYDPWELEVGCWTSGLILAMMFMTWLVSGRRRGGRGRTDSETLHVSVAS